MIRQDSGSSYYIIICPDEILWESNSIPVFLLSDTNVAAFSGHRPCILYYNKI